MTSEKGWIRVSAGTASALGLSPVRPKVASRTAFLFQGGGCAMGCSYCGEARDASESPKGDDASESPKGEGAAESPGLSRVSWPAVSAEALRSALSRSEAAVERVCLQGVAGPATWPFVEEQLASLPAAVPVSLSIRIRSLEEVERALALGVEKVSVALDAADADTARRIGRTLWERERDLLLDAARRHPGRMATHLIAGLGERDDVLLGLAERLLAQQVTVGLFAFTPVPGTPLEGAAAPPLPRYRRLQAALYLLQTGGLGADDLVFDGEGNLSGFAARAERLREHLADGRAFETSGCTACNRPFYNESPRGPWYNYPRSLTAEEVAEELARLGL